MEQKRNLYDDIKKNAKYFRINDTQLLKEINTLVYRKGLMPKDASFINAGFCTPISYIFDDIFYVCYTDRIIIQWGWFQRNQEMYIGIYAL